MSVNSDETASVPTPAVATLDEIVAAAVRALQIVQSQSEPRSPQAALVQPSPPRYSNKEIAALLPTFSGDSSEDIEHWMSRIEAVQTAYGVSEEIMQVIMVTKMSGPALEWYHSKIDYITMPFELSKKEIKSMFASRPSRINLLKKMESR
ncbi:hypothetical protein ILUMI_17272, partial [Ignelater luminosus]